VGLVVDAVAGVSRLNSSQIEPPSAFVRSAESGYLRGIAKIEDGLLILLDLDKVLDGQEVVQLAEMMSE
jgi:purine-binding chemotaxis protein CheW